MTSWLGNELHPRVILVEEATVDEVALLGGVHAIFHGEDTFKEGRNASGTHGVTHVDVDLGVDVGPTEAERVEVAGSLEGEPDTGARHRITAVDQVGCTEVGGTTRRARHRNTALDFRSRATGVVDRHHLEVVARSVVHGGRGVVVRRDRVHASEVDARGHELILSAILRVRREDIKEVVRVGLEHRELADLTRALFRHQATHLGLEVTTGADVEDGQTDVGGTEVQQVEEEGLVVAAVELEPGTIARLESGEEADVHVVGAGAADRTNVRHAVLEFQCGIAVVVDGGTAAAVHAFDREQELVAAGVLAEAGHMDVVILALLDVERHLTHEAFRAAVVVSTETLEVVEVAVHGLEHEDLRVEERVARGVEGVGTTGAHDHLLVRLRIEHVPHAGRIDVLTGTRGAHEVLSVDGVRQRARNLGAALDGLRAVGVVVGRRALTGAVIVRGARVVVQTEGVRTTEEGARTGLADVHSIAAHLVGAGSVEVAGHVLEVPSDVIGIVARGDVEEVATGSQTHEVGSAGQPIPLIGLVERARRGNVAVELGDVVHGAVPAIAKGVSHADLQDELACRTVDAGPVINGSGGREVRGVEVRTTVAAEVAEAAVEDGVRAEVAGRRIGTSHRAAHVTKRDAVGTADELVSEFRLVEGAGVDHLTVVGREGVDAIVPTVLKAVEHLEVVAPLRQADGVRPCTTKVHNRVGLHVADVPADLAVPASAADFEEEEELLVAAGAVVIDGGRVVVHRAGLGTAVAAVVADVAGNGRSLVVVAGRRVGTPLTADVFATAVVEVGRGVVVAGALRGTAYVEASRLTHEEELLNRTTGHTGTAFQDDLAVTDDLP